MIDADICTAFLTFLEWLIAFCAKVVISTAPNQHECSPVVDFTPHPLQRERQRQGEKLLKKIIGPGFLLSNYNAEFHKGVRFLAQNKVCT